MKIRQKFVVTLLLISIIPMGVVSVIVYESLRNSVLSQTINQLNSTAIKQEQKVRSVLLARQEDVVQIADQFNLQSILQQYIASPNVAHLQNLKTILQNNKIAITAVQSLYLTDLNGKLFTSSDASDPTAAAVLPPAENGTPTVTVRNDARDNFSKLYITTIVSVNKQKTAMLTGVFRTDDLVAVVQDYTGLDETGETVVASKDNTSLFPLRFDTDAALKTSLASLDLFGPTKTSLEETDYRGKRVFVVARPVGLTDWVVAAKIDKDEAQAPLALLRNQMTIILITILVLLVAGAFLLTSLFTRPILSLGRILRRIGLGDFTARADSKGHDEMSVLADGINVMIGNLKDMINDIDSQRQRSQIILDATTEAIFAIDEKSNVILANHAAGQLLQTDPLQIVNKNMQDVFAWKYGAQEFTVEYHVSKPHIYSDLQFVDKAGIDRYVTLIVAPVTGGADTSKAHTIVTVHDETPGHALENMKTDFVSMAAHELRTPLTAVRGYLEMAQDKYEHNDLKDIPKYVHQALKNVSDLGGLINNLLDVTRIERGTLSLRMEKLDMAAEVARAVEDARFLADDRQIHLSYAGPVKQQYVAGDPIALREIFINLLSNAIKYTHPNGNVDVTLIEKDGMYKVAVKDTGIGIPTNALPYLFTKFYRVHGGLESGSTGTGLGLFIAKSIAERHHGTVSVVSKVGEGSTFTFTVPVFSEKYLADMQTSDEDEAIVQRKRGWMVKNVERE